LIKKNCFGPAQLHRRCAEDGFPFSVIRSGEAIVRLRGESLLDVLGDTEVVQAVLPLPGNRQGDA
jgi:hypothetical protein